MPTRRRPGRRSRKRWRDLHGVTPALVLVVLVALVAGAMTYVVVSAATSPTVRRTTVERSQPTGTCQQGGVSCGPAPPPPPPSTASIHDLRLAAQSPGGMALDPILFWIAGGNGPFVRSVFYFGDGNSSYGVQGNSTHAFGYPGDYLVYAQAVDGRGVLHDNLWDLLPFRVAAVSDMDPWAAGGVAAGVVASNTTAAQGADAVLRPGAWVNLSAELAAAPLNPRAKVLAPSFLLPGGPPGLVLGPTSGSGWNTSDPLRVTVFAGIVSAPVDAPVVFATATYLAPWPGGLAAPQSLVQRFVFSVFVGPDPGGAAGAVRTSPHPGTIQSYLLAPGGASSLDPSSDYETVGAEVIYNTYEILVGYNGSQAGPNPSGFVPIAAECVPGTQLCQAKYGSSLISSNGQDYTFVINPAAKFYNPMNGAIMNVYPRDVLWSFIRTCLFANYPGVAVNPGWIQCQALLPFGDPNFDGGLHFPWNSTPNWLLQMITLNDSTYCTSTMMDGTNGDGCVTFHTGLSGAIWPEFLELVADPNGAAIQSCAWETSVGFTLAGWTNCNPPSTAPGDTAWDSAEQQGSPTTRNQAINTEIVGSGVYYLASYSEGQSYSLKVSPTWTGTTCVGGRANGCLPGPTEIAAQYVSQDWETSQTPGETAYAAGTADFATIPSTDTPTLLNDISRGLIGAITEPTINIFFDSINLAYAVGIAQQQTTTNITAPSWVMQDMNMRQFIIHSFPFQTEQNNYCTTDGVQYCILYGGAIPKGMGNFYPGNITWPSGDPVQDPTVQGGAAWWWSQLQADSQDGSACGSVGSCVIPVILQNGDTFDLPLFQAWAGWVAKISGNHVQFAIIQINFATLVNELFSSPGSGFFAAFNLGWLPDYPDPSDYTVPMYLPDSTYTYTTAWGEALLSPPGAGNLANQNYLSACAGTMSDPVVTNACQGRAYEELINLTNAGNSCAPPACDNTQRVLLYNMAEKIANELGMFVWQLQQVGVGSYALWISPASFNPNPTIPGAVWYNVQYQP